MPHQAWLYHGNPYELLLFICYPLPHVSSVAQSSCNLLRSKLLYWSAHSFLLLLFLSSKEGRVWRECVWERKMVGLWQEDTPLAGSSAGALVCAVVGGGLSMYDALQATKELAHDCRTYGTAFRLGVSLIPFSFDFCLKLSFGNSICLGFQTEILENLQKNLIIVWKFSYLGWVLPFCTIQFMGNCFFGFSIQGLLPIWFGDQIWSSVAQRFSKFSSKYPEFLIWVLFLIPIPGPVLHQFLSWHIWKAMMVKVTFWWSELIFPKSESTCTWFSFRQPMEIFSGPKTVALCSFRLFWGTSWRGFCLKIPMKRSMARFVVCLSFWLLSFVSEELAHYWWQCRIIKTCSIDKIWVNYWSNFEVTIRVVMAVECKLVDIFLND